MTRPLPENDADLFTCERVENVEVLTFHKHLLYHLTDLAAKNRILDYLDSVSKDPNVRVLLIMAAPKRLDKDAYITFYRNYLDTATVAGQTQLKRLYNGLNQFILKLSHIDPFVVHAGSGNTAFLFMNISLACDYRITSEETLFENPIMELGLPPKGGGVFFLSHLLGPAKCAEILYSGRDIDMEEAMRLNLVQRVVKRESLRTSALETAHAFAHKSPLAIFGTKKLLGYAMKDLEEFLEYENKILEATLRRHQHTQEQERTLLSD